jgi:hypothetical protein
LNKLCVYLVKGPIDGYATAIETIEKSQPLEKIRSFNLHIKGTANSASQPNQIGLIRELGARPAIQVLDHGLYSTVKLSTNNVNSLVATLQLTEDPDDLLICILSECDIIAIDVDIDEDLGVYEESIPVQGKRAFPWIRVKEALEA